MCTFLKKIQLRSGFPIPDLPTTTDLARDVMQISFIDRAIFSPQDMSANEDGCSLEQS